MAGHDLMNLDLTYEDVDLIRSCIMSYQRELDRNTALCESLIAVSLVDSKAELIERHRAEIEDNKQTMRRLAELLQRVDAQT